MALQLQELTNLDYFNLTVMYGECERNLNSTIRRFSRLYPQKVQPTRELLRTIFRNAQTVGSFHKLKRERQPRIIDEDTEIAVLAFFAGNPNASTREAAQEFQIGNRSIWKILKKHKYRPYKYSLTQNLHQDDNIRRIQFCEWFIIKSQDDPDIYRKIIWSDESKFTKNGLFNRHNVHYWTDENLNVNRSRNHQVYWSFNMWCGIKDNIIIGPVFYRQNLDSDLYLNIIETDLTLFIDNLPLNQYRETYFQQDGAPAHNTQRVSLALYQLFDDRWIGNNGPILWPARSPDLTPLDFFFWGYLKNKVFSVPPTTEDECKNNIRQAIRDLNAQSIRCATSSELRRRIELCLQNQGGVFEHKL